MAQLRVGQVLAVFAALLVVGAPVLALDDAAVEGKVVAYEKGKSIEIQVGEEKKTFTCNESTVVEGEVAVGKKVAVSAKDGVATKIVAGKKKDK
jgi:hypothetical protein